MNKNVVMLLAALMTLSAGGTVVCHSQKHKAEKHHAGGHMRRSAHDKRHERKMMMDQYRAMHKAELERAVEAGQYADLYKSPAWGIASLFHDKKMELTVAADYSYACDSYGSSGTGSNSNITSLAFGEQPIRLQDILLASRLVAKNTVGVYQADPFNTGAVADADYLRRTANDVVMLIGKAESYGMNLGLSRYVVSNNISVGINVPVVYKRNRLNADYDFTRSANLIDSAWNIAAAPVAPAVHVPGADGVGPEFLYRYGNNPQRYLKDILAAKGINELGGSAAGLGDVSLFLSGQINSSKFDKLVVGARWQAPTGKKQSMSKLWSPDLGNGGFTELSVFGNVLVSYKKYCNLHASLSAGCSLPAHVDRRVPKNFSITSNPDVAVGAPYGVGAGVTGLPLASTKVSGLAFADRIAVDGLAAGGGLPARTQTFSGMDSLIPNFGDTVSRVRMTRGAEVKMRLGNIFEQFVSQRGFLDVFYDFRAKMKDMVSGLQGDVYDVESVRRYSNQLEHRLGFDYSYQFDDVTRLRLGTRYTVAGMNVPKAFDIAGSLNYDF